jgi:uncharacterized membrane protein
VHAHRVIFIDLARALAVVFMLYGHTVSALLAPGFRGGTWYDVWQFQRGLTASLFLLLSGFAFSVATTRHWASHAGLSRAVARRTRRFLTFVLLGYALHMPGRFVELPGVSNERWRSFLSVDVLQLIGVTFLFVQFLVFLTRTQARFTAAALALAVVAVAVTPWAWSVPWPTHLPLWAAAYLSPAVGSLFPLLPWAGYVLLGAALGQAYGHVGAGSLVRYATLVLLLPGAALLGAGLTLRPYADAVFGAGPSSFVPSEVLIRAGTCLLILTALAHVSRWIPRLPHVFGSVAQETLLIYFVHLCIVYGSVWNVGLARLYGEAMHPLEVLGVVVGLIGAMVLLASRWNALKHRSPQAARWISYGVGAVLLARLL